MRNGKFEAQYDEGEANADATASALQADCKNSAKRSEREVAKAQLDAAKAES